MKRLFFLALAIVLLTMTGCRRNQAEQQYEKYLESTENMEFITPKEDSVKLDADGKVTKGNAEEDVNLGGDDDGLMVIPDIPQERKINMGATNYDLEKMMSGRE